MAAEFKISRLRYNYLGEWTYDTFYNKDAIVSFEGKVYVCLVPHTSGSTKPTFYDELYNVTDGAPDPYWEIVISGRRWAGDWQPNTFYSLDNIVRYGGSLYMCDEQHTSGSNIDLAKFEVYAITANWTADWETNFAYGKGDVVKYGALVYTCNTNHVSAGSYSLGLEQDQAKWTVLLKGIEYTGTWNDSGYRYKLNDLVKNGADLWICSAGHASTTNFDQTKWSIWVPGQEYVDTYSSSVIYQPGDVVTYGGYTFTSLTANNQGNTPSTSPSNWELLTTGYEFQGSWNSGTQYQVGDVVRKNGLVYTAIQDNLNQNPNSLFVTKSYTASGSSGTTLVLSNTTGLTQGLTLIGTGFSLGQSIVTVLNSTTVILDLPPDGTLVDGQEITIVGTNYVYWNLIIPGSNWRNAWTSNTQYYPGDVVVLKNKTYKCIQEHLSNTLAVSTPTLDDSNLYWIPYTLHARKNALTNQGDILSFSQGVTTPIAIGEQDQVLQATKSDSEVVPQWKKILVTPKVYYVAETGIDTEGYGDTWDRPWRTIKYACEQVNIGSENLDIKQALETNKEFLLAEMYQWMLYQKANSIAPFTPSSTFDPDKTVRDAGFIIDGIIYDLTRLGTSQTVINAKSFFNAEGTGAFINDAVASQIDFFIAALNRLKTLIIDNVLTGNAPTILYQERNGITPGDIVEMVSFTGITLNLNVEALLNIVINALTNASPSEIPAPNNGISSTIMVKTGTYDEELPIVVPEYCAIVGDELRGVTVRPKVVVNTFTDSSIAGTSIPQSTTITGIVGHSEWQFDTEGTVTLTATGLPYHSYGNELDPNTPTEITIDKSWPWRGGTNIEAEDKVSTTSGTIGYWINGVSIYSPNAGNLAPIGKSPVTGFNYDSSFAAADVLGYSFGGDDAGGNADPLGVYHYSDFSFNLAWESGDGYVSGLIGTTGTAEVDQIPYLNGSLTHPDGHSKILGISLDGFPIYGPYGYTIPTSSTSGVKSLSSGYVLKDPSYRVGTPASNLTTYPMGTFVQDYEFTGVGDLDESNGRYCVTPDYPNGTYAYFLTLDPVTLTPAYPYVVGNVYRATPAAEGSATSTEGNGGGIAPLGLGTIFTGGYFNCYNTDNIEPNMPIQFVSSSNFITNLTPFEDASITAGKTYYVVGSTLTPTRLQVSAVPNGTPIGLIGDNGFMQIIGGDATKDMFRLRNASGLRNLTLKGLLGTLTPVNEYLTKRPTGGSYAALDPGNGPSDTVAWIKNRSPYCQNVTLFGNGCAAMKVDGTLHNGGNKSMTANDFTCIISDGIGAWITGSDSKAELISVFTYYAYTGYFAEDGGRIRAANGNCSYGEYGAIAEGYDITEDPITATIDNRTFQASASVQQAFGDDASLLKLQYNNAGVEYVKTTTNLLSYSNDFIASGWTTDDNVNVSKNLISPSGLNDGWTLTGTTSNTDSSYIYKNVTIAPQGAVYTGLSGSNISGSGSGATFDVTVGATSYSVVVSLSGTGGLGYVLGNQITIYGSQVGGLDGVNDITLTVASLVGSTIITVTATGTVPAGSALRYTFSVHAKKATSSSFDLYAIFSGSSTRTSYVSFNFDTKTLTTSSEGDGGLVPSASYRGVDFLNDDWYRIWFSVYDTSALNNTVQFRIYPRTRLGPSGSTSVYGAQVEIGSSPGFYLSTLTGQYESYADFIISGAGVNAQLVADEVRADSIYQTRVTDTGLGAGGLGYLTASNNASTGNTTSITLSGADVNTSANYNGMRIFINSGTGAGQFGFISNYDFDTKIASVLKESVIPVVITSASTVDDSFTLEGSANNDVYSLWVNQPVQFIPTYYNTTVTATSQESYAILSITGGTTNTIAIADTTILYYNMAITFSGNIPEGSGVVANFTYFVSEIIDQYYFKISSTSFGPTLSLGNVTVSGMNIDIPSGTSYLTVPTTANMVANMPIQFTGSSLGGITLGNVYYINDVISGTRLTISSNLLTPTITNTDGITNRLTVSSTGSLVPLNPIIFSEPTIGGVNAGQKYYISKINSPTAFQISDTILTVTVTATAFGTNLITCSDTSGFIPDNPIKFTGNGFGGLTAETTYYILAVNNSTTFTVATSVGASSPTLTSASGYMTARTCPNPVTLISDAGTMTAKTTTAKTTLTRSVGSMNAIFSTPVFGGVTQGTTYYIKSVDVGPPSKITISETPGGPTFNVTTGSGTMQVGEVGWDHVNPGTPAEINLDTTSLYYIEPRLTYSSPTFSQSTTTLPTAGFGTSYVTIAYGDNYWIAVPNGNTTISATSDGVSWSTYSLPTTAETWSSLAYGNTAWVLIASGTNKVLYSFSKGQSWKASTMPSSDNWSSVAYGNARFVAISSGTSKAAYTTTYGSSWLSSTLPGAAADWTNVTFGNGRFVTVAKNTTRAAYSTDGGATWTQSTITGAAKTWSSVKYGNGRFVAVSSTSEKPVYSFDGITWYESPYAISATVLSYGNGVFLALEAGSAVGYTSEDGRVWKRRNVNANNYGAAAFGFSATTYTGRFITVAGASNGSRISAGAITKGRPIVESGVVTSLTKFETGGGYSSAPTITVFDPNVTTAVSLIPRLGNGVLSAPTFINRGIGYNSSSTSISINGNGYADEFQTGLAIRVSNLTQLPRPGDDLSIDNNSIIYKVTNATILNGTSAPNLTAEIQISPDMSVALSPEHGTNLIIREKYSQCRLTNHDFLNIGFGDEALSDYPNPVPAETTLQSQNQTIENNYGRVFYTSTDQDGNFKVGNLFGVEQATGIVTLSASQFGLTGLETLTLGGIAVGGSSVVISQFSTDSTFVANSDTIIPTQKAIKSYLTARLSQGGSNTFTGNTTAGSISIGNPNIISNTVPAGLPGSSIKMLNKVMFDGVEGGMIDGSMTALNMFLGGKGFDRLINPNKISR